MLCTLDIPPATYYSHREHTGGYPMKTLRNVDEVSALAETLYQASVSAEARDDEEELRTISILAHYYVAPDSALHLDELLKQHGLVQLTNAYEVFVTDNGITPLGQAVFTKLCTTHPECTLARAIEKDRELQQKINALTTRLG
jgi:hypothetical protein